MHGKVRLYLMGLLWSVAAIGLWLKSLPYLSEPDSSPWFVFISSVVGFCLAWAKSTFILDRVAQRMISKAQTSTIKTPRVNTGLRLMAVIVLMSGLGWGIRDLHYDATVKRWIVSLLYPGIGLALLRSSLVFFGIRDGKSGNR